MTESFFHVEILLKDTDGRGHLTIIIRIEHDALQTNNALA